MASEIELLTEAIRQEQVPVEKETNRAWDLEDLQEAASSEILQNEDQIQPAEPSLEISGPFPGCLQRTGATEEIEHYQLVGQTRHFLLYERPKG